ncbi:hypothetical protein C8Q80DRAFT_100272 [Daedaleopsis nitida]|nr:hypothetical protein C8Q80DRAFT_100272 [Daedaleopsis nitida]
MSGSEREFSPSPSPFEEFEGDPNQAWDVSGIVGESVDALNETRYEVRWEGWSRKDGTNTTWNKPSIDLNDLADEWDRKRAARRLARVKKSPAVAVGIEPWHAWHEDRTIERARGYDELKQKYLRNGKDPHQPIDFDAMCISLRPDPSQTHSPTPVSGRSSAPRSTTLSSRQASAPSSSATPERRATRPLPERANKRRAPSSPVPDSEEEPERRARRPRTHSRRESLESKWAQRLAGAAPVTFVNEVTNENVPRLVDNFQYLERRYARAQGVPSKAEVFEYLVSCECEDGCKYASECGCQGPSELKHDGQKIYAYSRRGLFRFKLPAGTEVIECNQACACEPTCRNRVAQRPRDVPIQIFRTHDCGWGARATVDVPRGKVLGIYTGLLIRREEADGYEGDRKSYIFDLDVHEGEDDGDGHAKYSVDGYAHGNWTRFVNHSCEPNLQVVPVIWDTIPEFNQPYLAFVATQDIPHHRELTIDYDPKGAEAARNSKGKGRAQKPEGARDCVCGMDSCRQWVRV